MHVVDPVETWKVPTGQLVQLLEESSEYMPVAQELHLVAETLEYLPAGQLSVMSERPVVAQ